MKVELNAANKTLAIKQEIIFVNQSDDTLNSIVLNDWNHAFSNKNTPLAKRFSDEFYRGFHLAKEEERGSTINLIVNDATQQFLSWQRTEKNPDYIVVELKNPLLPNQKVALHLSYITKIPNEKFTKYGYSNNGSFNLKNWYLTPARYENHSFVKNSNNNLDDIANAVSDFEIDLKIPRTLEASSDLNSEKTFGNDDFLYYRLSGNNRTDFSLIIETKSSFESYRNSSVDVLTDLKNNKVDNIQKAIVIDRIVNFANNLIGKYPYEKIIVSQTDYEKNPFYGLNQLPSFLSPFPDEFIFEIKFLKTYLNEYLKKSLHLDPRKDNWIYDGIQVYAMMKYMDENHPKTKMMGSASNIRLLKSFNLTNIDFNGQYSYFYMLMARKNLDQPLGDPKNTLVKFNEQIASKYRAGLSIRFLDDYLQNNAVPNSIKQFYEKNRITQVSRSDFETIIKSNSNKDINWFFNTIINSRDIIDYKFSSVTKTKDSITFSVKNRTGTPIPIPIYGTKKGEIVFKQWLDIEECDSTFTIPRNNIDKIVLNLKNEVPEYNLRNNWKKLEGFFPNNRPVKFVFMKDLEDPYYNQVLYVPSIYYNLYDGITPGLRLHNKTILEKPFIFDVNPSYSTKSNNLSGSAVFVVNQNFRKSNLYNARYSISGSYFHYAEDASYFRLNPAIQLRIREPNFRDNRKQLFLFRQVIVNKEKSALVIDNSPENYSVFDARYINTKTEVTNHFNFTTDLQISGKFGKITSEIEYRKLFEDNRQINLRFYAGSFLYNKTQSDFFSFALDRPTDYLFDYNYFGRSESTGLFSQQYVVAEGGFKSKIATPFANRWITSFNASYSIWNWIEAYGDVGFIKNKDVKQRFVYDSGIRLNLVTDYFELYFPVYSSNGWEISQDNYNEKIRFIVTFSPKTLINLFNRKWF
ncbi:gluzincin family metallopeptidase [Flavobacterium psychrolimnae]|uniref:Aminopeptidase n=1 Tax=Flavobacterium psychrolimnae TaxID=249351 RepID=A0A366B5B7_9FLAO|nr:aminopeptidase [Flavobacterium psychrolimnae]RBN51357.1 aminopeptidase [Flavobacterium psychrolimnae]